MDPLATEKLAMKRKRETSADEDHHKRKRSCPSKAVEAAIQSGPREHGTVTPFRSRVLALCAQIPESRVSTYKAIAAALGTAPRAVGGALRHNPYAPCVPCHRVVAAGTRKLHGFSGVTDVNSPEMQKKADMLVQENVPIDRERHAVSSAGAMFDDFDLPQAEIDAALLLEAAAPKPEKHRSTA